MEIPLDRYPSTLSDCEAWTPLKALYDSISRVANSINTIRKAILFLSPSDKGDGKQISLFLENVTKLRSEVKHVNGFGKAIYRGLTTLTRFHRTPRSTTDQDDVQSLTSGSVSRWGSSRI